jgi:hypothetical protein
VLSTSWVSLPHNLTLWASGHSILNSGHSIVLGTEVGYSWVGSVKVDRGSMGITGTLVGSSLGHF